MSDKSTSMQQRALSAVIALSPRDQVLLGLLLLSIASAVSIGGLMWLWSSVDGLENKITSANQALSSVAVLKDEQLKNVSQISEKEELLRSHENTSLSAFLESKAQTIGIREKLNAVKEVNSSAGELLQEKRYSVSLKNLSTEELSKFLYQIESASFPLMIQSTNIKRRKIRDEITLNVSLDVSVYSLLKN